MKPRMYRNLAWTGLGFLLGVVPSLLGGMPAGEWMLAAGPLLIKSAHAAEPAAFTDAAFQAAQQAGKPILVHVNAGWCPTCARQRPILDKLEHSAELGNLTVFTVDFDTQKDVLHEFNVQQQSTLIVFNGKTEKGRATGITDAGAIRSLLMRAEQP